MTVFRVHTLRSRLLGRFDITTINSVDVRRGHGKLWYNSLRPVRCDNNWKFSNSLQNSCFSTRCKNMIKWTPQMPTLVQAMAWCRQAPSHYLSQYRSRFISSYGDTRPDWVDNVKTKPPNSIEMVPAGGWTGATIPVMRPSSLRTKLFAGEHRPLD